MSDLDLAELERLAREATPGPWSALSTGVRGGDHWYVTDAGEAVALVSANDSNPDDPRRENAQFIAATDPDTVLALVERVREAERLAAVRRDTIATYERENADWSIRAHTAERRIEKAEDFITRHYLDTDMGRDVLAALTEGDEQ